MKLFFSLLPSLGMHSRNPERPTRIIVSDKNTRRAPSQPEKVTGAAHRGDGECWAVTSWGRYPVESRAIKGDSGGARLPYSCIYRNVPLYVKGSKPVKNGEKLAPGRTEVFTLSCNARTFTVDCQNEGPDLKIGPAVYYLAVHGIRYCI